MTTASRRLTDRLTAATIATYAVVVFGATLTSQGGSGAWMEGTPSLLAIGHAVAAALAAVCLGLAVWEQRRIETSGKLGALLGVAVALFPIQAAVGAAIATGVAPGVAQVHLLLAIGIFGLLLGALVLALEETTESAPVGAADLADPDPTAAAEEAMEPAPVPAESGSHPTEPATEPPKTGPLATARAYLQLTKPRLMWLLCLLALGGIGLAALEGAAVRGVTVVATLAGGVLAIGASGAANHVFERDRDEKMERTADRPLATGFVSVRGATAFSLALAAASIAVLWTLTTPLATGLTVVAMIYYGVAYTVLLKPRTRWNTVIGGGSGALPAVIGWAAVTGNFGLPAILLAVVVFCWTPAHFYNLALAYREDYAAGGYPMMPVVLGARSTRRRIVAYLGVTALATVALATSSNLGGAFAAVAVIAAGGFLYAVVGQYRDRTEAATLRTFHASNAYLAAVLAVIVVQALVALA